MNITFTNIRSLLPKRDYICSFLDDSDTDILALTETWLHDQITDSEILPDRFNFNIYRRDRHQKRGGGVLLAVKKTISSFVIETESPIEIIWASCMTSTSNILIGVCYRPPDASRSFIDDLHDSINLALKKYQGHEVYLLGDFNYPQIDWPLLSSTCSSSTDFLNLTLDFNFSQIIDQPTRGSNVLDLVLTTAPETIGPLSFLGGFSDHKLIQLTVEIPTLETGFSVKQIRDYSRGNYDGMNAELDVFLHEVLLPTFNVRTVESNWLLFKDKLCRLVDKYVPLITISNHKTNPWFNKNLRTLRNKKKRLYKKATNAPCASTWKKYTDFLKVYKCELDRAKKKYFTQDLPSILKNNPRKFWRTISPCVDDHKICLFDDNDTPLPDEQCASAFNSFFTSIFTREDHSNVPIVTDLDYPFMETIDITPEGIASLINNLKVSTSSGVDNINTKILKNTVHVSSQILFHIFTQSLASGQLPIDWKIAKVIPVFKNGNKTSRENYRPISLTCICCKLLEHIIASHIFRHLEKNKYFYNHQHGFRKGLSCNTQLLEFSSELQFNLNNNQQTDCIFLDFSKAFDRVAHCRLISKLSALRIDSLTLSWLRNFLSLRLQFTIVNDTSSTITDVTSGVPQGSVLGPLLFLIYINDLPDNISSCVRLFADDCVIYRVINTAQDHIILQKDLDQINSWCTTWQMILNTTKCKTISFSRKHAHSDFTYYINNEAISRAAAYKYLGIIFTSTLSWATHITSTCAKASKTLGYLRRNLRNAPIDMRKLSYFTFVRPQLEFASSIWSPHQSYLVNLLESIQNRAARFISRNYSRNSSITQIKLDIPLQPLHIRRVVALLCLFHKYVYSDNLSPLPLEPPSRVSSRLHNQYSFKRIYGKTLAFNSSALPQAISHWNDLPDAIASISNPDRFREQLNAHFS